MLIIYTKTGCPWCLEVLEFLKEKEIKFEEKNVTNHLKNFDELKEKSGQEKCPTLDLNGEILPDVGVEEVRNFLFKHKILN